MEDFIKLMNQEMGQYTWDWLNELPYKARVLALTYYDHLAAKGTYAHEIDSEITLFDFTMNKSPIECLFHVALFIYNAEYARRFGKRYKEPFTDLFQYVSPLPDPEPQYEISVEGKKYIADFAFLSEDEKVKVLVECDGHEFHHKTKKQVEYDNERQLALQTAGYDVIRFSGSQIYKDPLGCAEKAYNFILSKIKN